MKASSMQTQIYTNIVILITFSTQICRKPLVVGICLQSLVPKYSVKHFVSADNHQKINLKLILTNAPLEYRNSSLMSGLYHGAQWLMNHTEMLFFQEVYGNFLLLYMNSIGLMIDGCQMPPRGVPHTRRLDICIIIEMNAAQNRRLCSVKLWGNTS